MMAFVLIVAIMAIIASMGTMAKVAKRDGEKSNGGKVHESGVKVPVVTCKPRG